MKWQEPEQSSVTDKSVTDKSQENSQQVSRQSSDENTGFYGSFRDSMRSVRRRVRNAFGSRRIIVDEPVGNSFTGGGRRVPPDDVTDVETGRRHDGIWKVVGAVSLFVGGLIWGVALSQKDVENWPNQKMSNLLQHLGKKETSYQTYQDTKGKVIELMRENAEISVEKGKILSANTTMVIQSRTTEEKLKTVEKELGQANRKIVAYEHAKNSKLHASNRHSNLVKQVSSKKLLSYGHIKKLVNQTKVPDWKFSVVETRRGVHRVYYKLNNGRSFYFTATAKCAKKYLTPDGLSAWAKRRALYAAKNPIPKYQSAPLAVKISR